MLNETGRMTTMYYCYKKPCVYFLF